MVGNLTGTAVKYGNIFSLSLQIFLKNFLIKWEPKTRALSLVHWLKFNCFSSECHYGLQYMLQAVFVVWVQHHISTFSCDGWWFDLQCLIINLYLLFLCSWWSKKGQEHSLCINGHHSRGRTVCIFMKSS